MALYAVHDIQKACAGDLKPGFQFFEGWDPWTTQQLILSQKEMAGKAGAHVPGQQKGLPARGKSSGQSTELVITWTSRAAQQGMQESHLHRTLRCHVRLNAP